MLIGNEQGNIAEYLLGEINRRSRIQDHGLPRLVGDLGRLENGRHRNLKLHQQNFTFQDGLFAGTNILLGVIIIGPRCYHNAVFGALVNRDQGDPGRLFGDHDSGDVQSLFLEVPFRVLSEYVISDLADELHIATKSFGRYGLVGSFASRAHDEIIPKNSLAWSGHFSAERGHVSVGASNHQDLSFHIGC